MFATKTLVFARSQSLGKLDTLALNCATGRLFALQALACCFPSAHSACAALSCRTCCQCGIDAECERLQAENLGSATCWAPRLQKNGHQFCGFVTSFGLGFQQVAPQLDGEIPTMRNLPSSHEHSRLDWSMRRPLDASAELGVHCLTIVVDVARCHRCVGLLPKSRQQYMESSMRKPN